jgi:hypothetical protein
VDEPLLPVLFLSAAYGRIRPVSARSVIDEGGVDVRNVHLATSALADLRWARRLAVGSSGLLAGALVLSWYGPAEPGAPVAFAKAQDGTTTGVEIEGEPQERRIPTSRLLATVLVDTC